MQPHNGEPKSVVRFVDFIVQPHTVLVIEFLVDVLSSAPSWRSEMEASPSSYFPVVSLFVTSDGFSRQYLIIRVYLFDRAESLAVLSLRLVDVCSYLIAVQIEVGQVPVAAKLTVEYSGRSC